ncbi:unnamed protein product, partial [Mesorhabditis spiculigera]
MATGLKAYFAKRQVSTILQRWVLLSAVAVSECYQYPNDASKVKRFLAPLNSETLKKPEPEAYDKMKTSGLTTVYFNKGL